MEINVKLLTNVMSQIHALNNMCIMQKSAKASFISILWLPIQKSCVEAKNVCEVLFKVVGGDDLFDDTDVSDLNEPLPIFIPHLLQTVRSSKKCVIENGLVNGKNVSDDIKNTVEKIKDGFTECNNGIGNAETEASFALSKAEYEYVSRMLPKFVSYDIERYFMTGVCFDTTHSDNKTLNIVATNARDLISCKTSISIGKDINFIVPVNCFLKFNCEYSNVLFDFFKNGGRLTINAGEYQIVESFLYVDGMYPNYPKVIPTVDDKMETFIIETNYFRDTIKDIGISVKRNDERYIVVDASNPDDRIIGTLQRLCEKDITFVIKGSVSRPMKFKLCLQYLLDCLSESVYSKFLIAEVGKAFMTQEKLFNTFDVTKVLMPARIDHIDNDKIQWGV